MASSSGSMVSGSVLSFHQMKEFESHVDAAEAEGDLETLVLFIGVGTGGARGRSPPPPHFPGRGERKEVSAPPLLGSHISQDPAKILLLSPTQFHSTDS